MLVENARVKPGEVISETVINEFFTDIDTVTSGNVDAANTRNEGIDINQFNTNTGHGRTGIILKDAWQHDNGASKTAGTVYTSTSAPNNYTELSHDSGARKTGTWNIESGDVLRMYWHVYIDSFPTHSGTGMFNPLEHPVWLVWLQWTTDPTLTTWAAVPNQGDFDTSFVSATGELVDDTCATMVIPHGTEWQSGGSQTWTVYTDMHHKRSWYWEADGSYTVYGWRLVIDGLYHPMNNANTSNTNALVHTNAVDPWADEQIEVNHIRMAGVHMRGD